MKILVLMISLIVIGCGSSSKKKEEPKPRSFQKEYKVVDAQYGITPAWINEPQDWARSKDTKDANEYRYFVYDTDVKNSRSIACRIAKANASATIATEITQFIKQSLATSTQGNPIDLDSKLDEYVEATLAQEVQSFVVGARVFRTYWEQRKYMKELGADRDFKGFTCAALVKISRNNLQRAVRRAQKKIEGVANPEVKDNVKKALADAEKKFVELDS